MKKQSYLFIPLMVLLIIHMGTLNMNAQLEVGKENNVGIRKPEMTQKTLNLFNYKSDTTENFTNIFSDCDFRFRKNLLSSDTLINLHLNSIGHLPISAYPYYNSYIWNQFNSMVDSVNEIYSERIGINNNLVIQSNLSHLSSYFASQNIGINNKVIYENSPEKKYYFGFPTGLAVGYGIQNHLDMKLGLGDRYGIHNLVTHQLTQPYPLPATLQYGIYNCLDAFYNVNDTTNLAPIALYSAIKLPFSEGARRYAGYFEGDVKITNTLFTTNIVLVSDVGLKQNIVTMDSMINKIKLMRPVEFKFDTTKEVKNLPTTLQYGFIAQEMEAIIPEIVENSLFANNLKSEDLKDQAGNVVSQVMVRDPDYTYKGINYIQLIPVLIKAMQEQQDQIDALIIEVEILKNK